VALAGGVRLQVTVPNLERHGDVFRAGEAVLAACSPEALVVLTH